MKRPLTLIISFLLSITASCSKEPADKQEPATASETVPAPEKPESHAPAGVQPGSHEDWCGAHEVPESMCTICNPKLAAAFKASGDWCQEHSLPESQCRICNPEISIERPPKSGEQ